MSPEVAVRLEGANHQWRKIPPGELSINPEADERLGRVTGWALHGVRCHVTQRMAMGEMAASIVH